MGAFNTTRTNHTLVCLPDPFTDVVGELPMLLPRLALCNSHTLPACLELRLYLLVYCLAACLTADRSLKL